MITKEMIQNGFQNKNISIESEFEGCICLCCRIGDNAFYFAGAEDEDLTAEEYLESYTMDEIIDMLYEILKDVKSAEENGLCEGEWEYYKSILDYKKQSSEKISYMFKEIKKTELKDIYLDYCLSKEEGRRCESLVPYAEQYKARFGDLLSLRESIDNVAKIFFEEIANRYFK